MSEAAAPEVKQRTMRRWWGAALEGVVSIASALAFLGSCALIRVYPLDRLGQVSALASLALRFMGFGLVLLAALVVAARADDGRRFATTSRLVCAALAGIVSGMVAGGILVALRGTPWGLNGAGGDVGVLAERAAALHRGEPLPPLYPPLSLHALHLYSDLTDLSPSHAIKHLQILGTAAFGPVAYLSWRFLLRPVWALGIGVISTLPLIEPYKPYSNLVLIAFVPFAILFLDRIREVARRSGLEIARAGVGFGLAFGVMCLTYSGWFQWAAPGLLVATLIVFPWKQAPRKAAALLAVTGAAFLLVSGRYMAGLLDPAVKVVDDYVYFDVNVEPMYIAMWRGDAPGAVGVWPPIGELGGVGLFTLALALGLGLALAVGRKTTPVLGAVAMLTGAWLLRLMYARKLWDTHLVQLYPRTTLLIVYCLFVATGFAVLHLTRRASERGWLRGPSTMIGALCTLMLVFCSAGSAIADRYMPSRVEPVGVGLFAYMAHLTNWNTNKKKIFTSRPLKWNRRGDSMPQGPTPAAPAQPAPSAPAPPRSAAGSATPP